MIQKYSQLQHLYEPMKTSPVTANMVCLNKIVVSLDDIPLGYVRAEENGMMIVTDHNDGYKFAIPSCKVISVVKGDINKLIVDIEHHEAEKYRTD